MNPSIRTRRIVTLAWQHYLPLNLANVQRFAPVEAGVYKIAVHLMNGKKQVIYVGQADARLDEVEGVVLQGAAAVHEVLRQEEVVAVEEEEQVAGGVLDADVAGVARAARRRAADQLPRRPVSDEVRDDLPCLVRRAVIHDHDIRP